MKKQVKKSRNWYLFDAKDKILGRLSTEIANTLRGKNKPSFDPAQDIGDYAVVINVSLIAVTGKKLEQKKYYRHSGYPGGLKTETLNEKLHQAPEEVIRHAVNGMLPDNKLRKFWLNRLYIFKDEKHPFEDKVRKNA